MRDEGNSDGLLAARSIEQPVAGDVWRVPGAVELDGKRLLWRYTPMKPARETFYTGRHHPGLLEKFYRLADAPNPGAIVDYARENGVLYLCEHDRPSSHAPRDTVSARSAWFAGCDLRVSGDWYWEPIEVWRRYARRARALVNVAVSLQRGEVGEPIDWQDSYDGAAGPPPRIDDARLLLEFNVRGWLDEGHVLPAFQWVGARWTWALGSRSLFGALGLQLSHVIAKTRGTGICSGCGERYLLDKVPIAGQRGYCRRCRDSRVSRRHASQAYYWRTKGKDARRGKGS